MTKEVIPTPYKVILRRFNNVAIDRVLEIKQARHILTNIHRIGKTDAHKTFLEMEKNGWIEHYKCYLIKLKFDEDDLE